MAFGRDFYGHGRMKSDADLFTFTKAGAGWCLWHVNLEHGRFDQEKQYEGRCETRLNCSFFDFDLWIAKSTKSIQKQSYHDFCRPITGVPSPFAPQKKCWDKISAIRIDWGFCSCWHHGFSQRPTPWPRGIQCRMESGSCKERPGRKMMMIRTAGWNMAKHGFQWMAVFDFWWWTKTSPGFIRVFMPQKSH